MTLPAPVNPVCGHSLTSIVTLAGVKICRECQDVLAQNLILTLEAQNENMADGSCGSGHEPAAMEVGG
jgi:hypothetical protein